MGIIFLDGIFIVCNTYAFTLHSYALLLFLKNVFSKIWF